MRERMRKELSRARPGSGKFDIKQDAGGTADIEFLAQYWALLHAGTHPPVVMFADTIRQLESVASADLVPQATVDVLTDAYRKYRERSHHLSLENAEPVVPAEEFAANAGRGHGHLERDHGGLTAIIRAPCQPPETAHPAQRPERIQGRRGRSAAGVPDAGDVSLELASAGLSTDRADRLGEVPVLRRRVHVCTK